MAGLSAKLAFFDHLDEQRSRCILLRAKAFVEDIHDVENGVVANQIRQCQRPDGVVHAEFHDAIDGFGFSHAFLERENGLVDHGAEDAVGYKAGRIVAGKGGLTHLFSRFNDGAIGCFAGAITVDDFNEFHDGNRVHEMHTDDLVGSVG